MVQKILLVSEAVIIGLIALCGLIAAVLILHASPLWSSEAAGWAAALGTIGAIIGAIWIGRSSVDGAAQHAKNLQAAALERKNSALRAILDSANNQCDSLFPEFQGEGEFGAFAFLFTYNSRKFGAALTAIEQVRLHELESYDAVFGMSELRDSMISIKENIERILSPKVPGGLVGERTHDWFRNIGSSALDTANEGYCKAMKALGGVPSERPVLVFTDEEIRATMESIETMNEVIAEVTGIVPK